LSDTEQEPGILDGMYKNPKLTQEALDAELAAVEALEDEQAQALIDAAESVVASEEPENKDNPLDAVAAHNFEKRYKDLQSYKSKSDKEKDEKIAALQSQLEDRDIRLPKTAEDLTAFKEQYPDIYATIETVAELKARDSQTALDERMNAVEERELTVTKRDALVTVKAAHPDLEEIVTAPEFIDWVNGKTESGSGWVKAAVFEATEAAEVIDAISLYKQEAGIEAPKKRGRPKKSSDTTDDARKVSTGVSEAPGTGNETVHTQKDIDNMSDEEFAERDAKGEFVSV
jgi:hypothetical protein